jgi:hypothetical protein
MRPAETRYICELYWHSITKVSIIIPSTRSTFPPGLSQNPRGIPQPRITLTSQAQGTKIHPHNLPDLLSGRGLTHEGTSYCLSMYNFNIWKHPVIFGDGGPLETENNVTTLVKETKAEHFSQFQEAFKNCSSELFFGPFERLILIFSAIFWFCMITKQLLVKK